MQARRKYVEHTARDDAMPLVQLTDVQRSFGSVRALAELSLSIHRGDAIALLGLNGAGKSTLLRILGGLDQPDSGAILVNGRSVRFESPRAALDHGISLSTQEPELFPDLSVYENLSLGTYGRLGRGATGVEIREQFTSLLNEIDSSVDLAKKADTLPISVRQIVALSRSLLSRPKLLLIDEPTTSLAESETSPVFRLIQRATARGMAVLVATHRFDVVESLVSRVVMLRDGRVVEDTGFSSSTARRVRRFLGPELPRLSEPPRQRKTALSIDLPASLGFGPSRLLASAGESIGLVGAPLRRLSRIMRSLAGLEPAGATSVFVGESAACVLRTPADAVEAGIAYVTSDRQREGIFAQLSVAENLAMLRLASQRGLQFLSSNTVRSFANSLAARVKLVNTDVGMSAETLSGGNQQKLILARLLAAKPKVLLLDNATRGLDSDGRAYLVRTINEFCARGGSCIVTATEIEFVRAATHRLVEMPSPDVA